MNFKLDVHTVRLLKLTFKIFLITVIVGILSISGVLILVELVGPISIIILGITSMLLCASYIKANDIISRQISKGEK